MALIGFHASHEQFTPSRLVRCVQDAEKAGFGVFFSSDHFHPWSENQGESGFSWAFLGAAMQATSLPARVICCPFQRYHPAIVAQASATLAEMFPGRFHLAIGSGQALNESITGEVWPAKDVRDAKLRESAEIIRALWAGETVTRRGMLQVENARLYTRPQKAPLLIGAAVTEKTAEWLGGWADGMVTTSRKPKEAAKMLEAFRRGGGTGKPVFLKVGMSYGRTDEIARQNAFEQWRAVAFSSPVLTELHIPSQFDEIGKYVRPEDLDASLRISGDVQQHIAWLEEDIALGFEEIYLHNVGTNQEEFIDVAGNQILPALSKSGR